MVNKIIVRDTVNKFLKMITVIIKWVLVIIKWVLVKNKNNSKFV
jgi:hypothetical protein